MMELNWSENGWQLINCVVQVVTAVSAWVTIILIRRQVSSTTKVKLKMYTEFQINMRNGQTIVEIVLHIVNLGMAPIYVEEWGMELWQYGRKKYPKTMSREIFELKPGKPHTVSSYYPSEEINDEASLHDNVRIYVKCRLGETYYAKKKESYNAFKFKYEKVKDSAKEAYKEI